MQLKYIVRPSAVKDGSASRWPVLITGPRFSRTIGGAGSGAGLRDSPNRPHRHYGHHQYHTGTDRGTRRALRRPKPDRRSWPRGFAATGTSETSCTYQGV